MLILMSALRAGGYGGVQTVNQLIMGMLAAEGVRDAGAIVLLDEFKEVDATEQVPQWGAGASKFRFLALALRHRALAAQSVTLVTHVGLTPVARIVKVLTGTRIVAMVYGVEADHQLRGTRRWGLSGADQVVAISQYTLDAVRSANRYLQCPASVCHLPVRPLPPVRAEGPPRRTSSHVLIVGRLWGRGLAKGQDRLIRIWPSVCTEVPDAKLIIVGDGDGRHNLEKLAAQVGVDGSVVFPGAVCDLELSKLYQESAVFALPSEGEGFGLVLAEAMHYGLPCIASIRDAGAEVIEHERTGIVVDPRDSAALLAALIRLLSDGQLRSVFGVAGQDRVAALFTSEMFHRCMLEHLHR